MAKFWEIAFQEYSRHVFRRRFVFALFSLPAFILVAGLISFLAVRAERSDLPVGYVDLAGLLPVALGLIENKHGVIPDLSAALPGKLIGKIRPTGDQQGVLVRTDERSGEAELVGQRREFAPGQGVVDRGTQNNRRRQSC